MSIITSISVQDKDKTRCNVFLDGEFGFALSVESVIKLRLKKGDELTEKQIKELTLDGEKSKGLYKGIAYSSRMLKMSKQVKTYLYSKGFSDNVVYYVVDKLKENGYVNDLLFAQRYIECNALNKGKRMLEYKLLEKGVSKSDIEKAFELTDVPSENNAVILAKKYFKNKEKTYENFSKTFKYLLSHGFSYSEAETAVNALKEEYEDL